MSRVWMEGTPCPGQPVLSFGCHGHPWIQCCPALLLCFPGSATCLNSGVPGSSLLLLHNLSPSPKKSKSPRECFCSLPTFSTRLPGPLPFLFERRHLPSLVLTVESPPARASFPFMTILSLSQIEILIYNNKQIVHCLSSNALPRGLCNVGKVSTVPARGPGLVPIPSIHYGSWEVRGGGENR